MAKALVIKDANFAANKVTTVELIDPVPCTAISLNHSSYSLTAIGATVTLTASVLPLDTTDEVTWSTSNASAATVSDGVVTAAGIGTATITATCGSQTATCAITVTNELTLTYTLGESLTKGSGSRDYAEINPVNESTAALYGSAETTRWARKASSSQAVQSRIYPILLGAGATTVTADVPSGMRLTAWFLNTALRCEYSPDSSSYDNYARVISGDSSYYDTSVALGDRTITIPQNVDSVVFTLQNPNGSISASDIAELSIVVS